MPASDSRSTHLPALSNSFRGGLLGPLAFGLAATGGFYWLVYRGPLNHPQMHRYFAGHPINVIETAMFFVGLAALVLKLLELMNQQGSFAAIQLPDDGQNHSPSKAGEWLETLAQLPSRARNSYIGRRFADALDSVQRKASAETLDEDLKHLSDADSNRAYESYGLVRIIIWAIPMLGFLGTVVGITEALGGLDAKELTTSLETAIKGLTDGLYVAFDTTAIALSFSMVLMFAQFMLDRSETQLLQAVDQRVEQELTGRFEVLGASTDPQVMAIQRIGQALVKSSEQLVQKQVDLWQQSIAAAHDHWRQTSEKTANQIETALTKSLTQSLSQHAIHLAKIEQSSADQLTLRWEQWQTALSHNARLLHAQQQELVKQGEVMTQAIRAAGEVVQLEKALNDNLSALAGSKNFEDTVMSLSAAIHLLNTRLGKGAEPSHVELKAPVVKGRAA